MVRSLLLTFFLLSGSLALTAQTLLTGSVRDEKEELIGATVKVMKGTEFIRGGITDALGNYRIQLDPGTYNVEVSYTGYATSRVTGVQVLINKINAQDFTLSSNAELTEVVITEYKVPLIKQDETSGGQTLTSETIKNLPTRSVNQIVATTAGATSIDGGDINIKGSRANGTNYYIDGIRVAGSPPPVQDIEQLQVVTGGLGAEYGDVTGGVISVVTKGPASEYHGAIEVENSHGLDAFGWLLAQANISGPIVRKKMANGSRRTLVGFRLSGQYWSQKDDDPTALPVYRIRPDLRENLSNHPLRLENGTLISAAEQMTNDSMEVLKYRPDEDRRDIDITSKLDFRISDQMDFSVTGTFKDVQNQSTPEENQSRPMWRAFNSHNNPIDYDRRYRAIARFRHRLGNPDAQKSSSSKIAISNANYQLQLGFERAFENRESPIHHDRIFDYGYVGRFDFDFVPVVALVDGVAWTHVDYREEFKGFTPGTETNGQTRVPNQGLVNYNEYADPTAFPSYVAQNGRFLSNYNNIWSNMHSNINKWYDQYSKDQKDIITIMANTGFDLKLGKTGVHNIQIGIMNEQRTNRFFRVNPFGLWNLMQLNANNHFNGVDTSKVIGTVDSPLGPVPQYGLLTLNFEDNKFYREARAKFNVPIDQYFNVNNYSPDDFNLGMFSPRELTERGLISYYGFDHTGQIANDNVSFEDFFTSRDAQGVRNFPIAPLRPLYQAAFIKDKFTFNKMIFSLGMRVERFDLNTKVLRDKYSLYNIMSVREFYERNNTLARPSGVGDDYKVYVTSSNDVTPRAFRNGDTWYFDDGRQANDGTSIFGGQPVVPYLSDTIVGDDIFDPNFNTALSFEDYTPQVNWLPRLAFSFPISNEANFFAHYDVLVQRPQDSWEVSPLTYLYFYNPTAKNNANMRPERVVDYEVGFQQKLNNVSALKFSAYYRELRDMIQRQTITNVPVINRYDTYANIDFGTVKGFTLQYDLRRVRNAELRLAYTLQFADGTGSDANSQRGLTSRGNLRTLYPLNFDERHNINAIFDYRFASGKAYNGPRIAGKDILALFGANFQVFAVSGRPYTARIRPTRFSGEGATGQLNGNRLPWRLNIDMRLDKSFNLAAAGKRPLNVNVYFRVSNLLNRRNVVKVYPVTGSPSDDGFLAGGEGIQVIQELSRGGRSVQAFRDAYSWMLLDPDRYTQPRRMYVGCLFEF